MNELQFPQPVIWPEHLGSLQQETWITRPPSELLIFVLVSGAQSKQWPLIQSAELTSDSN